MVLTLRALCLVSGQCPEPENITPCLCTSDDLKQKILRLVCEGNQINDLKSILKDKLKANSEKGFLQFKSLLINNTSITTIESETFGDAVFERILIKDNANLTNINPKAFQKTIENNISLDFYFVNSYNYESSEQLFALINSLQPKQELFLEGLGLKEIPDNAFELNPIIEFVVMLKNEIKRIGKSAFVKLPKISTLALSQNQISDIDSNGLTFDLSRDGFNLWVLLDQNQLTENSFRQNWSNSEVGKRKIEFQLDRNSIKSLPESVFKPVLLLTSTEHLFLANNRFVCDCHMKYLLAIREEIEPKLKSVYCSDSNNVLALKEEEIGQC